LRLVATTGLHKGSIPGSLVAAAALLPPAVDDGGTAASISALGVVRELVLGIALQNLTPAALGDDARQARGVRKLGQVRETSPRERPSLAHSRSAER